MNNELSLAIFNLVHLIKANNDYESAIVIMKEKRITFEDLITRTCKLTQREISILADKMLSM